MQKGALKRKGALKIVPNPPGKDLCQGLCFDNNKVEKKVNLHPSRETILERRVWGPICYPLGHRTTYI